jgi:hypothetical protein
MHSGAKGFELKSVTKDNLFVISIASPPYPLRIITLTFYNGALQIRLLISFSRKCSQIREYAIY